MFSMKTNMKNMKNGDETNLVIPDDAKKWRWFVTEGFQLMNVRYIRDVTMDGKYPAYTGWTPKYGKITCKTLDELIEKAMEYYEQ